MDYELSNTIFDLEVLKDKLDDVATTHGWHGDDVYKIRELKTKNEYLTYAYGYSENRIHHEQTNDLLMMYLKQLDELISKFKTLDIKRDRTHDEIGNGQHNEEQ